MKFKSVILRWGLRASLLALLILVGWLGWLDWRIVTEFSGRKWDLPSHIYARPLEVYAGAQVSRDQLVWELEQLGYRRVERVSRSGQFSVQPSAVSIHTRGFPFWDSVEPSQRLEVVFAASGIQALRSDGPDVPLIRLEPMRIGGIFPATIEDRLPLPLGDLPPLLVAGLVAVEDRAFFEHRGISLRGIARALVANMRAGAVVEGGSTLTQQLVKNFYLTRSRTLGRKAQEAVMSLLLEIRYSKEQILETYLNEVFLGQSGTRAIHGMGMASWHYFRQPPRELQTHQVALLIGMLKGPSLYDPWRNPSQAKTRRDLVLRIMADAAMIEAPELERALAAPLDVAPTPARTLNPFPAYMALVKQELNRNQPSLDPATAGYAIFTALDPWLQDQMEKSVTRELVDIEGAYGIAQGSLQTAGVLVRIGSAEVVALMGDRDPRFDGFNRALSANRPIGSLIKPFIYLTALQHPDRYRLSSLIEDAPFTLELDRNNSWSPENYDGRSHGPVTMIQALSQSLNLASARLGLDLGVATVVDTLRVAGAPAVWQPFPSVLLGSGGLTPIELATAYHTLAADGYYSPLRTLMGIYDSGGNPQGRSAHQMEARIDPAYAHLLQYAMQVAMTEGTGRSAASRVTGAIAGKTGTTNDQRDSWFAGFDGAHLGVFWVGLDDNGITPLTGATGALRLWSSVYQNIGVDPLHFVRPPAITYYWVNPEYDELSSQDCPSAAYIPFVEGSQPTRVGACSHTGQAQHWLRQLLGL